MVTEANSYLSDRNWSKEEGVGEDTVNVSAHVLCWLLVEFFKSIFLQGDAEVRLILTEVAIKISTDDGGFNWVQKTAKMTIQGFVALTPVDVD